jgi:multiple sugar transport system ATP-binding protein
MNFAPCILEEMAGGLQVRLNEDVAFPVPQGRAGRYRPYLHRGDLLFGLRPEHILERRSQPQPNLHAFDVVLEVTEPMGMETLVYFRVNGMEVCGRVNPNAGAKAGAPMTLVADLNNMHLIDDASGKVL